MALFQDNAGERTEQPTPLRLREARQRGQVARSADVVAVAVVAAGLAAMALWGPGLLAATKAMTKETLHSFSAPLAPAAFAHQTAEGIRPILWAAAPLVLLPLAAAVVGNCVQFGLLAASKPIQPDAERISPTAGLKRLGSLRSGVRGLLACAKLLAVAGVCLAVIPSKLANLMAIAAEGDAEALLVAAGPMVVHLGFGVVGVLGLLAGIDWLYQRWQYRQDLKITPRELREDLKQMEGDAQIARHRKHTARRRNESQRTKPTE